MSNIMSDDFKIFVKTIQSMKKSIRPNLESTDLDHLRIEAKLELITQILDIASEMTVCGDDNL